MPGLLVSFDRASFLLGLLLGLGAVGLAALGPGRSRLGEARDAGRRDREAELAVLRTRLEEHSRAADQRYRDLEQARDRLKAEFRQMAQEILEDKARRFSEQNASQLGQLLNPLREQIGDFRRLVSESYEKEGKERAGLQAELRQLFELNRQLAEEADSLTRALTADNRTQGYWGELKLERLLESAGLEKGQQYLTQESFT